MSVLSPDMYAQATVVRVVDILLSRWRSVSQKPRMETSLLGSSHRCHASKCYTVMLSVVIGCIIMVRGRVVMN